MAHTRLKEVFYVRLVPYHRRKRDRGFSAISLRSFQLIMNSIGPRMDPSGTPILTLMKVDIYSNGFRSDRNKNRTSNAVP